MSAKLNQVQTVQNDKPTIEIKSVVHGDKAVAPKDVDNFINAITNPAPVPQFVKDMAKNKSLPKLEVK